MLCNLAELQTLCQSFWNRISELEGDKFDLEYQGRLKQFEVTVQVINILLLSQKNFSLHF